MGGGPRDRTYPDLSPGLADQLDRVPGAEARWPSARIYLVYKPCILTLLDGTVLDRVYVQNATDYINIWGVWPDEDRGKTAVDILQVTRIASSPTRLPPLIAEAIYLHGETRMGGTEFTLAFSDGNRQDYITGNAVDWVPYPEGKGPRDVVGVTYGAIGGLEGLNYAWCLYGP
jgi:hypothetical protein